MKERMTETVRKDKKLVLVEKIIVFMLERVMMVSFSILV